ncbi:unnamed protein product, partial [Allacma fusca]
RKARKDAVLAEKRGLPTPAPTVEVSKKAKNVVSNSTKKIAAPVSFESLMKRAQDRGYVFEKRTQQKSKETDSSLKAFYREFQQVIKESDIIVQVLDARDPLGSRSEEAEETVREHSDKKLIMVLNKCDLIPVDNLKQWISYLRQTTGTAVLPFKANTQKQKDRLGSGAASVSTDKQTALDTKKSIGVSDLLGLLGTWARSAPGGITVGVVGMPNVGKSSIINSLKRSRACSVGAKPGVTRACQVVHLDSKLKLIDSPGVCFSKEKDFASEDEFLAQVALKYGLLKKGGIPNGEAAQQKIIHDWHTGQIRFFTEPPELTSTEAASAIVTDLATPFSLDNWEPKLTLEPSDDEEMNDDDSAYEDMDLSDEEEEKPPKKSTKKVTFAVDTETKPKGKKDSTQVSPDAKKRVAYLASKKESLKKFKKSKKRSTKKASELSDVLEGLSFDL